MKRAVWFSQHTPTQGQLAGIATLGYYLDKIEDGIGLGSRELKDDHDLNEVRELLMRLIQPGSRIDMARAVFGVFPPPVVFALNSAKGRVKMYSSWNGKRTRTGCNPTFEHLAWCEIGRIGVGW
jgi:hypothetical protein